MAVKKHTTLDRVLGRLDSLDQVNLANLVQRLARERRLFEEIFNTLQEGLIVIDDAGRVEYANKTAHDLVGLRDEELGGTILWRLVPGLRASIEGDTPDAWRSAPVVAREIELTYPEPRIVRLYIVPFQDTAGSGENRRAVILSDITREKQNTEERIEAERTSSILLLAASVAHELGNPLNSLTIHLQLLERRLKKLKGSRETEAMAESLQVCRGEVARLDGIITHFLEAIRPRPPKLAETDLLEVLGEVLRFQQKELEDRGISVEAETESNLPPIMADRDQLKQVFFNLTKNAMEAMGPQGKFRIRTRFDDDCVYLLFGDNGSGIRQEDLVKLFQPYHTTKTGGSGLGLMIVQRIMRGHGGHIGIESKEGVGTVVTLQFPRKDRRVRMLK
ncbi:nitrogen regulation protein NR(II) [Nibricoccus sp. IMCC34717]|uniref:two-component system sensor histidine kinase NtrB n=1 Tax=Nibricoccus sp. IMCC34717 TaxID=3034021 RepID=UPI00384ADBF1